MPFCFDFNFNRKRPTKSLWRAFDNNKIFLPAGELVAVVLLQTQAHVSEGHYHHNKPLDQLAWPCNIEPLMGTLFQTFNFLENKTHACGKVGLFFENSFLFYLVS